MKKILLGCICLLFFGCVIGCSKKEQAVSKEQISGREAKVFMEEGNTVLVDVRTDIEYDESHIEGAISIPVETPKVMIERMLKDKDQRIIVYCQSGNRSKTFKETLTNMGYTNVYDLGAKDNWED